MNHIERGSGMPRAIDAGCFSPDLVADFGAAMQAAVLPKRVGQLRPLVEALIVQNTRQWDLEDQAHDDHIQLEDLARAKREIDQSNFRRLALIAEIDAVMAASLMLVGHSSGGANGQRPRVHVPDTLGQMIDRLSIAQLRVHRAPNLGLRDSALRVYVHLLACVRDVLSLTLEGRVVLPPEAPPRVYCE